MLKHYVEFLFLGSFMSETQAEEIPDLSTEIMPPQGAFGYRLFSREEVVQDGETLLGKAKNHYGITYYGDVYTLDQVRALPGNGNKILIANMECNKWDTVVRTIRGNWQPILEGDRVIMP